MADFISQFTGTQIDNGIDRALNPDATPTQGSAALIESGGVFAAINSAALSSAPAILNTASGAVCAFADGSASPMTSVVAEIVANQAGSGTPYPAGGGKNKIDYLSCVGVGPRNDTEAVSSAVSKAGNVITITQSFADGGAIMKGVQYPALANGQTITLSARVKCTGTAVRLGAGNYAGGGTNLGPNNISVTADTWTTISATFTAAEDYAKLGVFLQPSASGTALEAEDVQLEFSATATDYAPYSNIRPISGFTGANVTRAGRNILAPKYSGRTNNYVTFTVNGNEIKAQGTATSNAFAAPNYTSTPSMMTLLPAGTYFISSNEGISGARVYLTGIYTDGDAFPAGAASGTGEYYILTKPAYVYPNLRITSGTTIDHTFKIQVEVGNEAHDYEPYAGEVFSVSWQDTAGTVYGGTVDLVSGLLTGTWADKTLTNWPEANIVEYTYGSKHGVAFRNVFDSSRTRTQGLCNMAEVIQTVASDLSHYMWFGANTPFLYWVGILDALGLSSVSDFVTWLRQNDLHIVYPLATPVTYQLTPQEVTSLLGVNTLWNDTNGDTSAEYRANTKLYIDAAIAALG